MHLSFFYSFYIRITELFLISSGKVTMELIVKNFMGNSKNR